MRFTNDFGRYKSNVFLKIKNAFISLIFKGLISITQRDEMISVI